MQIFYCSPPQMPGENRWADTSFDFPEKKIFRQNILADKDQPCHFSSGAANLCAVKEEDGGESILLSSKSSP